MSNSNKYGSIYKVKTSDGWEFHYFKTRADLINGASYTEDSTTYYKYILDTQYITINNKTFGWSNNHPTGITLDGEDILVGGAGNENDYASYTLEAAIRELKAGVDAAQTLDDDLTAIAALTGTNGFLKKTAANTWALDTTVLTSGNYSTTLASVYQAKFTDGSATIATVGTGSNANIVTLKAGISQSGGKIANNSSSDITLAKVAKTGAFSDLSGTSNVVTASEDIDDGYLVVGGGTGRVIKKWTGGVGNYPDGITLSSLVSIANGACKSIVTDAYPVTANNTTKYYLLLSSSPLTPNSTVTNSTTGVMPVEISAIPTNSVLALTGSYASYGYITLGKWSQSAGGSYTVITSYPKASLDVGDILYITNTGLPDFWVSDNGSSTFTFSIMETAKVPIENYASIGHTHALTLAADSGTSAITLAHGSKYKLTAGGNSIVFTMPSDNNTNYYHNPNYDSGDYGIKIATGVGVDDMYVPAPTTSHGGIVPTLNSDSVSSQTQSTKFLREDGTWAAPSYTTNTDTKNTTGSTDTESKIYLVGATSQAANPQTYSHGEVYIDTDHCLYSNSQRVRTIYVTSTTPSNAVTGDIWIDTTGATAS